MLMLLNQWAEMLEYLKIVGSEIIENCVIRAIIKWQRSKYGLNVKYVLYDPEYIRFSDIITFKSCQLKNIYIQFCLHSI